ncbi:Zn(II)2Cys6 transcription factor domain-containing protein [Aspergillus brunneoviolaceus CBS 621.78]|uniref:Uncharacterized protein n=1 Tax=Aspergillus brunneoviolaceus CBS 621.78 TaxID=1450534 RepID=A0ACD1G3M7_9EURO|nr:hypothetical protein BO95DRAFT_393807 [Aspergillus brunneoviolaceus CBS 621.78]RAH43773.1 hypothetical protein BO95DRAFT_393807 [Aspergillus brunneoviolaceus CBS 621.78]
MSHMQVSRVVKPLFPTARRRQNTSCDPCRRSKRRCVILSLTDDEPAAICTNCKRLNHHCTFDFIKSVSSRPRKRKDPAGVGAQLLHLNQSQVHNQRDETLINCLGDGFEVNIGTSDEDFTSWLNFDIELSQRTSTDIYDPFSASSLDSSRATEALGGPSLPSPSAASRAEHRSLSTNPQSMLVGRSRNSPIRLLNSKLEATVLDECLASIYNTIVRDSASRFIDYECNLSASGHPYYLESRFSEQAELGGANKHLSSHLSATQGIRHPRMTMLGAVRFLDHFSHLYGNKLSIAARKQSDTVLKAVLRVFSLQWLPTSEGVSPAGQHAGRDALIDTFHDSWIKARSLIQGSLPVPSFRVVCAILLFDGIVIPSHAYDRPDGTTVRVHEFLDIGLQKLSRLDDLVRKYCRQLGPTSLYGTLLHSSLDIIRWGGYIRDIGAALFTDYQCKLPELLGHRKVSLENNSTLPPPINHIHPSDLDASIPRIYRTAVARAFSIWRMMIKVKDLIPPSGTTNNKHALPLTSWEIIASTMTAVDDYNHTLRPFMAHCMESYAHLSTESKIYALSVLTFWDLGTLIFAQTLTSILHHPSLNHDSSSSLLPITKSQIRTLQETAVISIAQAIGCSLTHPVAHDTFNLQNGLSADLPLTAYHITPTLMVTALRLAIETSIELWLGGLGSGSAYQAGNIGGGGGGDDDEDDDSVWQEQVDVLVKGLLSLEVTIGGSQAVAPVLEDLLRRYGDVVSECWSCEF